MSCAYSGVGSKRLHILYLSTALSALFCAAAGLHPVQAQEIIDGGDIVTVPGDHASPWVLPSDLIVGDTGDGTLNIEAGGTVTNAGGTIGYNTGSTGTVTVAGEDALWDNSGDLYVGYFGTSTLNIKAGGTVTNTLGTIGLFGTGTVTVAGEDALWENSGSLTVGELGTGTLNIEAGGTVTNTRGTIGFDPDATGTVTVAGEDALWDNSGDLNVGELGTGTLNIKAGGTVTNVEGIIGYNTGSTGTVTVAGEDALWENSGSLYVGELGTGTLNIKAGGTVTNTRGIIGYNTGSTGTVTVAGEDALWDNSDDLTVGEYGDGTLLVENGGAVSADGYISAGVDSSGAVGDILVTGAGSTLTTPDPLRLGIYGTGELTIADGGMASASEVYMGGYPGISAATGAGTLTLSGTNSARGVLETGYIGRYNGSASIGFDGGILRATGDQTNFLQNFDAGDVTVDAGGAFIDSNGYAIGIGAQLSGTGALTKIGDGTFTLNGVNTYTGLTTVEAGTLIVGGGSHSDAEIAGNVDVGAGATLGGSGTVGNTTVADGGILAPGSSVGTLTVDGNLTLSSGSILDYELGSPGISTDAPGTSDRIDVAGDLALNGTLNLAQSGDTANGTAGLGYYRLMTYGGALTDDGLTIDGTPDLTDPAGFEIQTGGGNVDLFIAAIGDDTLQHWQGGNGTWNDSNTQWLNLDGDIPVAWAGNHAVFKNQPGGFNGGTVTVEGTQSFAGLQFVDDGYRLEGGGALETSADGSEIRVLADSAEIATQITGTGGIVKTQAGTLILSGENTYTGDTTIMGGTVQISKDANLGHEDGALTFNGGSLATTGSLVSARTVTLAGDGGFDVASGTVLGLSGAITGDGDLVKQGDGGLTLTGDNDYGNTLVEAGTLTGDVGSISGDIGNAATMVFDQGTDASFAGDIAGLGGTDGAMVKQGAGTLTLDGVSTLDWTVDNGGLTSAAERFAGDVAIGADGAFIFDQVNGAAYAGTISGNGQFALDGGKTLLLSGDSSGFAGSTSINAGTLLVGDADGNGALGGSLDVLDGATLGGSGTVGSGTGSLVTVASGGTLSPGNSIGTLTVNGDLAFEAGSRFAVEVDPQGSDSDLVSVTGNATLSGGSVAHIGADGNYDIRSTYTILSAGTLDGEFDGVTSDFAFLTPDLLYDYGAGTVDLELNRNDRDIASAALTRNQIATAEGIESIGFEAGHEVYDAIAQLADDDDLIRASFDALSGEIYGSTHTALIEDSRFIRNAANDRIRAAFGDAGASYAPVLAYGPGDTPIAVAADHAGPVVWSHGFGSWGSTDSDGNAASLDRSTGGLLIGADGLVGDWRLGVLAGYSHSSFDTDDRASSGNSDNYHLGLYGGTEWGNVALRTGAAYTWHDIETNRPVAIPGLSDSLSADYNAGTFQAFGELGYGIDMGATRFEPFANLAYVNLHTDGFTERGGAAALSVDSGSTDVTFTTLGLRGEHAMTLGTVNATLRGMVGWRHAFGDMTPESTHRFSAGDAFTIAGVPIAQDAAVIEAGLDLNLTPEATFGLSYTGQIASDAQDHGFKANLSVRF